MKFSWRMIAAAFSYAVGVLGWCYVGGYKILTGPVRELILAQMAGSMSLGRLVAALIEGFIYLSLAGGVWCIGYMLSSVCSLSNLFFRFHTTTLTEACSNELKQHHL